MLPPPHTHTQPPSHTPYLSSPNVSVCREEEREREREGEREREREREGERGRGRERERESTCLSFFFVFFFFHGELELDYASVIRNEFNGVVNLCKNTVYHVT